MMMKQLRYGKNKLVFLKIEFNAEVWRIIFGPWAFQAHVVPALKYILIAAVHMAKKEGQLPTKIDILKFGTWCSCKISEAKAEIRTLSRLLVNYRLKILTQVLALKELLRCFKVLRISMKLIPPELSWTKHLS